MPRLYVNLDHVATIRQARGTPYPDLAEAIRLVESSGCVQGITLHLREDRRHVNDVDTECVGSATNLPFNFEMSVAEDIVQKCLQVRPAQATLVPERREELTTEGGLDLVVTGERVAEVTRRLQSAGITVSYFIDPEEASVRTARELGATYVELHTGRYADAQGAERARELETLRSGAVLAGEIGLGVNAGHGLTAENVGPVAALPGVQDLNIGHAIVARALFLGLDGACREMARAMEAGSG
jgi:pyridoxine 5-phosphate synthase